MEHKKKITDLKKSIEKFNDFSTKEKTSLVDSIEMLWLNAGIQKKKKDIHLLTEYSLINLVVKIEN